MIEADLLTYLAAQPTISALVDTSVRGDKLRPGENAPAITVVLVSNPGQHDMNGAISLNRSRFQINCWGVTYSQAKAIAAAVDALLDGRRLTIGASSVRAFRDERADILDPKLDLSGGDDVPFGVRCDYMLWHV